MSRIFCTSFPCDPPLAAAGLFTWSMEIPRIQVPGLTPKCQFVYSEPIPDMVGIRIIARGSPQLFSNASLAILTCSVSEWLFWNVCLSAYHHAPALPTAWRRVRRNLALCHGKAWKAKVADKCCPLKMSYFPAWNYMWICGQNAQKKVSQKATKNWINRETVKCELNTGNTVVWQSLC